MAYDGLTNYLVSQELNVLIDGKIDKIYEPNFEEIVLGIYSNGVKYALQFVINSKYYRANLTTHSKPNPNFAPNFCMTLRKHLIGTHITKIYTNNLERIIFIDCEGYNKSKDFEKKTIIVELMGKHSNLILVNKDNIIIDAMKHFSINSGSLRNIYAGSKYELPKSDKLDIMDITDKEEFSRVLDNNAIRLNSDSLSKIISNTFTGISKNSILSFENDLNISDSLSHENAYKIYEYLIEIIGNVSNTVCTDYYKDYSLEVGSRENNLQINFFLDDYYFSKETNAQFITYRDNLLKLILNRLSKLNNKLDTINKKISECKDADKYKLYGELITSNLYQIPNHNADNITLGNYYDNNNLITILLDKSISPALNAKNFFKKYKKLKNAKNYVDVQKQSLLKDIEYLESIVYEIGTAKSIIDIDDIYTEISESNVQNNSNSKGTLKSKISINSRKKQVSF